MKIRIGVVFAFILLVGCSQKFKDVTKTVKHTFLPSSHASLTAKMHQELPYAAIYTTVDDQPRTVMILAEAESPFFTQSKTLAPRLKWVSQDHALIVTQTGRIVSSRGLRDGLLWQRRSEQPDPLLLGLHLSTTPTHWRHHIDWQPNHHYNEMQLSQFKPQPIEIITIFQTPQRLKPITEIIQTQQGDLEQTYWIDPHSGQVRKSQQYVTPNGPKIIIEHIKTYGGIV
jgi:hypothetical protein